MHGLCKSVNDGERYIRPYQVGLVAGDRPTLISRSCGWKWKSCLNYLYLLNYLSLRAGLEEYERCGKPECCVAECDHKKRTFCGGREEGCQGGVKQHIWWATRVLFRTGLCVNVFFPSYCAIVHIFMYYICSILLHDYKHQPASKVG